MALLTMLGAVITELVNNLPATLLLPLVVPHGDAQRRNRQQPRLPPGRLLATPAAIALGVVVLDGWARIV